MSSTSKTANLQLNQWTRTDPVNVDDFNADNEKIDAAVAQAQTAAEANLMVKLMDVTTTTSVQNVELNLSEINVSDYVALKVYYLSPSTDSGFLLRLNKLTSTYQYLNGTNWANHSIQCDIEASYMDIILCPNSVYVSCPYRTYQPASGTLTGSQLATIDLFKNSAMTVYFPIGSRFIITGVKK